jgi:probable HAF family extracellular repeat protein
MTSLAATNLDHRLRLVVAGAVVITALTTATAGAALPPTNSGAATAATADAPQPRRPATTSAGFVSHQSRFGRRVYTPLGEVPGAAITAHLGINNHGQITGTYIDTDAVPGPGPGPDGTFDTGHGFVQDRLGHTTSFDVPGARITLPNGINDHGQIAGAYVDADGAASVHGFIRDRRGTITTFEVPFGRLHNVSDINHRGQIVGYYDESDLAGGGGFLRDRDGTMTTITYPGAAYTLVHGLNDRGQLVGAYLEPGAAPNPDGTIRAGTVHGFVWERGRFTSFDVPGSIYTQAFGINNRGQISGGYRDASGRQHAFLQDQGRSQTLDTPGGNIAYGINDRGEIVLPDPRAAQLLPVAT